MKRIESELEKKISIPFGAIKSYWGLNEGLDFDEKSIWFFLEKCTLVEVVLDNISEAFQFFDSQNARGKDLEPHDLLKAFHLREMNNFSTEEERKKAVEKWESMDTGKLTK